MHFKNLGRTLVKIVEELIRLEAHSERGSFVSVKFAVGIRLFDIFKLVRAVRCDKCQTSAYVARKLTHVNPNNTIYSFIYYI